jgi:hypothetical protein
LPDGVVKTLNLLDQQAAVALPASPGAADGADAIRLRGVSQVFQGADKQAVVALEKIDPRFCGCSPVS